MQTFNKVDLQKKVLLVSHEMTYTGAPRSLLNIAHMLKRAGYMVDVWTIKDGIFSQEFKKEDIDVCVIDSKIKNLKLNLTQYQFVILNTFFSAHLVTDFQKVTKTFLYIREAQNIFQIAHDCQLDVNDICMADNVICVSEYAEKFISAYCMPKKLHVLHNFVNDVYRNDWNIVRDGKIHYLLSGTYEKRKGFDIAIKAFLNMPENLKKITCLHIVGRKPEWAREYWEKLELMYDDRIIDHGEIADENKRYALYRKMNVFVIASRDESCSLVALEGAMLGKALIMSENVGAQYLDKKKAWVYETEDIGGLCRKMCELTSRKKLILNGIQMRQAYKKTSTEKIYKINFFKLITEEEKNGT